MEAKNLTAHSLLATFDDATRARKAVEELGRAGIEADEMSMGGGGMEKAGGDPDTRQRDVAVSRDVAGNAGTGAAIGFVVAGVIIAAVLLVAGLRPGDTGFWLILLGGCIGGGSVGLMLAGIRKLPLTDEWELTYDEHTSGRPVRIAVHASDEKTMERARKVLESEHPDQIEQLGPERPDRAGSTGPERPDRAGSTGPERPETAGN